MTTDIQTATTYYFTKMKTDRTDKYVLMHVKHVSAIQKNFEKKNAGKNGELSKAQISKSTSTRNRCHVLLVAKQDIPPETELTCDYEVRTDENANRLDWAQQK